VPTSTIPHFLQEGCPSCRPTNSVKARLDYAEDARVLLTVSVPETTRSHVVKQRLKTMDTDSDLEVVSVKVKDKVKC